MQAAFLTCSNYTMGLKLRRKIHATADWQWIYNHSLLAQQNGTAY